MAFGGKISLAGESEYRRALAQIMQGYKELQSEMKLVSSQFDKNDKSTEAVTAKTEALTKIIDQEKTKIELLASRMKELADISDQQKVKIQQLTDKYKEESDKLETLRKTVGEASKEYKDQESVVRNLENQIDRETKANQNAEKAMSDLRTEMNNSQTAINNTTKEIDNLGTETEDSAKQAEEAANGGFTVLKGVIANLASEAISKAVEGLKELAGKLVEVGKQSYNLYAENEQLIGGVETLYGDSAERLKEYAQKAYKTAGISANKYMEQATSFAAILLQGLEGDTEAAVDYADLAIRDMADNANKMGTNISSIQNAYQGFAKKNFTMLDNLKLGYGGTAGEMARLINDTKVLGEEITITAEDAKNVSLDKIIEAIHIVQEQLGITGTTAKEAEGTITGSMGQVKAAFENLLVAIADPNADVREWVQTVTKTIETMLKNALPRTKQIIKGMWTAIKTALRENMPELANAIIPTLENIGGAIKDIFNFILKNGDTIIAIVKGFVAAFVAFKVAGMIQSAVTALESFVALSNPVGLMCTALATLVGLFVALEEIANKLPEEEAARQAAMEETNDRIKDQVKSWQDLREEHEKLVQEKGSELGYYEDLWNELKKITDQNGKIKEGYEKRAEYIATQLKDVYGIEIDIVDGVIQKYEELGKTVEDVMEKRRAEIILGTQEEEYQKAIKDADAFRENLTKQEANIKSQEAEVARLTKLIEERNEAYKNGATGTDAPTKYGGQNYYKDLEKAQKKLAELQETYQSGLEEAENARYAIALYESNYANMQAGNYDAILTTTRRYQADAKKSQDEQIADLKGYYETEKKIFNDTLTALRDTGDERYAAMLDYTSKFINQYKDQLAALGVFVDGIEQEYGRLGLITSGLSTPDFTSAKGTIISGMLATGQPVTVESLREAMNGMQIVLDDEQVGSFVTKTVTRQVYATAS